MRLVELRWRPYAVPFAAEFATAHGGWRVREGAIVWLVTDSGVTGYGEIAPLPSHGTMASAELLSMLEGIAPHLVGQDVDALAARVDELLGEGVACAPLRCGIETAALDATARAAGVSVATMLSPGVVRDMPVNAVIDVAPCADAAEAARRAVTRGFGDIKLKVGVAASADSEVARVAAVRHAVGPDVRLRLDANGAWTESQAIEVLRALEPYDIELMEQPVAAGDVASLARVRAAARTPIAADEGVTGAAAVRELIDARAVDAIVVKPPVAGGLRRAVEMMRMAECAGLGVIVTSALDTGISVAAALQLAASLAQPARACGLATLELLEDDLIEEELRISNGHMAVPDTPGVGVTVDEGALARHAAGPERVVRA